MRKLTLNIKNLQFLNDLWQILVTDVKKLFDSDQNSTLDLMPHRVIPVTVFPPYATPRTFKAESIIFMEDPELLHYRVRRSIWSRAQDMGSWVFSGFNTYNKKK